MITLQEYLEEIDKITKENLKEMIELYGEESVCNYLNKITTSIINNASLSLETKELLLSKFKYFLEYYQKELETMSQEDIDLLQLYFKEISKYPLLTKEEEKEYAKNLKLKNKISIITKISINGIPMPIIDLEKIFSSITTKEDQDILLTTLKKYFLSNNYQESPTTKIVNYYLREYQKLSQQVGIPTIDDLNKHFSQRKKYQIFTNFSTEKSLISSKLKEEIANYIKYQEARTIIINHNLRLTFRIAKKYSNFNLNDLLDNINNGNIGIIKTVDKFEVDKGCKFSTYAENWIKILIQRAPNNENLIRYPNNIKEQTNHVLKIKQKLTQLYRREPTIQELAEATNLSVFELEELLQYADKNIIISIDDPLTNETDSTLIDIIPDTKTSLQQEVEQNELRRLLLQKVNLLSERQKEIIMGGC